MLGGDTDTRSALTRLLLKAEHVLEWRTELDIRGLNLSNYDMLLVDGTPSAGSRDLFCNRLFVLRTVCAVHPRCAAIWDGTVAARAGKQDLAAS